MDVKTDVLSIISKFYLGPTLLRQLTGKLIAQGELIDDRWQLYIENGEVKTKDLAIEGKEIECPHCHRTFVYDQ